MQLADYTAFAIQNSSFLKLCEVFQSAPPGKLALAYFFMVLITAM
jgi:hypothetical protein